MKWLGFKRLKLTSVRMDVAEIRRRAKQQHVKELAADIKQHGEEPIQAPTIRMPGKALLCGRDRIAAMSILGAKSVWVHVAQCDDLEAKELELSENIYRRADNRADLIAQLVALKEQQLEVQQAEQEEREPGSVSRSNQDTPRARARREVARAAGISVEAVRQDEARARQRTASPSATVSRTASGCVKDSAGDRHGPSSGAPAAEAEETPAGIFEQPEPNLNLLGCDDACTRAVCKFARPTQEAIDESDKHLRLALGALKPIENTALGQRLRQAVERVGGIVRAERPESVCPSCKGLPKATYAAASGGARCPLCNGEFFVSAERAEQAAPECFATDPPVVFVNGKYLPYADVRDGKATSKNGTHRKAEKTVRVVDENDNPFAFEAELDEPESADADEEQF